MASPVIINDGLLLWSQLLLLWSIAAYGITADPLNEGTARFRWTRWAFLLAFRAALAVGFTYGLSRSVILSAFFLLTALLQPLLRYRLPMRWLAEFEGVWMFGSMVFSLTIIRHFHFSTQWVTSAISPAQQAALCILASTLLLVVRGGTHIVRGILRKSGTLTSKRTLSDPAHPPTSVASVPVEVAVPAAIEIAAAAEEPVRMTVDAEEYNRGRLIGNLERIVLTIVVAAGSYAALAFLVAAKGVVRSDEFENNRDFTEYFLIGSLSSVLVALCAGLGLRFALIRLWPDLLTLQLQ